MRLIAPPRIVRYNRRTELVMEAHESMKPVYSSSGEWVALDHEGNLYDTLGEWIGRMQGQDVYTIDGEYAGFASGDGRILRKRVRMQRQRHTVSSPPPKIRPPAYAPLAPLFRELPWNVIDVFEEEPQVFTYVSDLRPDWGD